MRSAANPDPMRRPGGTVTLPGSFELRPRAGIVLVLLTITVAVVGWRIARDTEGRRVDRLAIQAVALFAATPSRGPNEAPVPADGVLKRVREITGAAVEFPDDPGIVVLDVREEWFDRRRAAAVRFLYDGEPFLLVVSGRDRLLGGGFPSAFPEGTFLSGERDGRAFIFWERKETVCMLVSGTDVGRAFDLVRRLFS